MRRLLILGVIALTAIGPARAEQLDAYLARLRSSSPQIAAIEAELGVETARARLPTAEYRPRVEPFWSTRVKQDSTLPSPKAQPGSQWGVTIEYVILDFRARESRVAAASKRFDAASAKLERRIADTLAEAAQLYVSAWGSREMRASCVKADQVARSASTRLSEREKDKSATVADLNVMAGEVASISVICQQALGDAIEAEALLSRFGSPKRIEKPWLPVAAADAAVIAENAPDVREIDEQILAATAEITASRVKRYPQVKAYGTWSRENNKDDSDIEAGLKISVDAFDSQGSDLSLAQFIAERDAAVARRSAMIETISARIGSARATITGGPNLIRASAALLDAERKRLT
ncbi:MAG: TolC family protein, partial [Hyphomicrobium sp.]